MSGASSDVWTLWPQLHPHDAMFQGRGVWALSNLCFKYDAGKQWLLESNGYVLFQIYSGFEDRVILYLHSKLILCDQASSTIRSVIEIGIVSERSWSRAEFTYSWMYKCACRVHVHMYSHQFRGVGCRPDTISTWRQHRRVGRQCARRVHHLPLGLGSGTGWIRTCSCTT